MPALIDPNAANKASSPPPVPSQVHKEDIERDLNRMLEALDLERLRQIDHFLRALPDAEVTLEEVSHMLAVVRTWHRSGRGREGFPIALKAVRCARNLGDKALLRKALTYRGGLASEVLEIGVAIDCLIEASQLAVELNDKLGQIMSLMNLGVACDKISLHPVTHRCLEKALSVARRWRSNEGDALALYAESAVLSNLSDSLLRLSNPHDALAAARRGQEVAHQALPLLTAYRKAQAEDALAFCQSLEVIALARLGMHDAARNLVNSLDFGNRANRRGSDALLALAVLEATSGNHDLAVSNLKELITDPAATSFRRDAMAALADTYESGGQASAALRVLQQLQAEVETARREVALEELHRIEGLEPANDDPFDQSIRLRIAGYRVAMDGLGFRLSSKLHYLTELAVAAEIREGDEQNRAEHIYRVGALCSLLAAEAGYGEETCWLAEIAGRLHDVGKSSIPDVVVLKKRPLNRGQLIMVQRHSEHGARLIADTKEPRLVQVVAAVRHHHERYEGGGYPSGLRGDETPLLARLVSIADSFDAMLQSRVYRSALSIASALEEVERCAGAQFDPRLAGLFVAMIKRLQCEADDLSHFLGERGRASPLVQSFAKLSALTS